MKINELMEEFEDRKALVEVFKHGFTGSKRVDGNKLSSLAVKIASRIDTENKNIKALAALILLSISSNLDSATGNRVVTKALGMLG